MHHEPPPGDSASASQEFKRPRLQISGSLLASHHAAPATSSRAVVASPVANHRNDLLFSRETLFLSGFPGCCNRRPLVRPLPGFDGCIHVALVSKNTEQIALRASQFVQDSWVKIDAALSCIVTNTSPTSDLEGLYQSTVGLCRRGFADHLFERILNAFQQHCSTLFEPWPFPKLALHPHLLSSVPDCLVVLEHALDVWQSFLPRVSMACKIFCYLDRTHLVAQCRAPMSSRLTSLFASAALGEIQMPSKDELADCSQTPSVTPATAVYHALAALVCHIRLNQKLVSSNDCNVTRLIIRTLNMYQKLDLANTLLASLAATTAAFYYGLANQACAHGLLHDAFKELDCRNNSGPKDGPISPCDFVALCAELTFIEKRVVGRILQPIIGTENAISKAAQALFRDNLALLLDATDNLLDTKNIKLLQSLYQLLLTQNHNANGALLARLFENWLYKHGHARLQETLRHPTWSAHHAAAPDAVFNILVDLKSYADTVVEKCFESAQDMAMASKTGFQNVMNAFPAATVDALCRYADAYMCSQATNKVGETEHMIGTLVYFFRHLEQKDIFAIRYFELAEHRVMTGQCTSIDAEEFFMSTLEQECGADYTQKLTALFKESAESQKLSDDFAKTQEGSSVPFTFRVTVCGSEHASKTTAGTEIQEPIIPQVLRRTQDAFQAYYQNLRDHRCLKWRYKDSLLQLAAPYWRKVLDLTFAQALVLLAFSDKDVQTVGEIYKATRLPDLALTLASLAMGSVRVLRPTDCATQAAFDSENIDAVISALHTPATALQVVAELSPAVVSRRLRFPPVLLRREDCEAESTREAAHGQNKFVEPSEPGGKGQMQATLARSNEQRSFAVEAAVMRVLKLQKTATFTRLQTVVAEKLSYPITESLLLAVITGLKAKDLISEASERTYNYIA